MNYLYEMHLHSSACSACAISTAQELVLSAKEHGYAGVVFTNHFYHGNTAIDRHLPWRDFVEPYRQDYLAAKQFGETLDVDVLFGLEEVYEPGKEALIYGLSPELIANTPELKQMNIEQLSQFTRENGGFIACAHPFRHRNYIPEPDKEPDLRLFDAIEVYNRGNTDDDNRLAEEFAAQTGCATVSGGDTHEVSCMGKAGIAFSERIRNNAALVAALKAGAYRLFVNGAYVS